MIPAGWRQEGHPSTKNIASIPLDSTWMTRVIDVIFLWPTTAMMMIRAREQANKLQMTVFHSDDDFMNIGRDRLCFTRNWI